MAYEVIIMATKRLKTAAEAAGYAMVNPEDFAGEAKPQIFRKTTMGKTASETGKADTASRWWPTLDVFSLPGGKAPA